MSSSPFHPLPPLETDPPPSEPTPKKRKIGSKACDACKIRKVRCSGIPPCDRCTTVGLECTFDRQQATRGPRSLRPKTLRQIHRVQQKRKSVSGVLEDDDELEEPPVVDGEWFDPQPQRQPPQFPTFETPSPGTTTATTGDPWTSPPAQRTPVETLVLRLCIYRLRLFPVWPIVAVEQVIASLQLDSTNLSTYSLANAIGAATMAQLKLSQAHDAEITDSITAQDMAAECRRARTRLDKLDSLNSPSDPSGTALDRLRTSFFLHVYHENLKPGGTNSLLLLREAITLAQLMGLDRAALYTNLSLPEQRMRRRILWHLFVTERGVAMLHKLPVVLTNPHKFPPLDVPTGDAGSSCGRNGPVGTGGRGATSLGNAPEEHDSAHVLPAFRQLVKLFWIFDQSGALEILQSLEDDDGGWVGVGMRMSPAVLKTDSTVALRRLQQWLRDAPMDRAMLRNDVQRADLFVTRQWMQILLWRALLARSRRGDFSSASASMVSVNTTSTPTASFGPVQIAREFLELISSVPRAALDAHGPSLGYKVYEISRAVTDALSSRSVSWSSPPSRVPLTMISERIPVEVLLGLQQVLASCRGGNRDLLEMLRARVGQIQQVFEASSSSNCLASVSNMSVGPVVTEDAEGSLGWAGGLQNTESPVNSLGWSESAETAAMALESVDLDPLLGDVNISGWYYQPLELAARHGVGSGNGQFTGTRHQ